LNEVTLSVNDETEVPNRYDSARHGVGEQIPTPCQDRRHLAVLRSSLVKRTGDVERCLVLWGVEVRYGDIEAPAR
jgi:hypothetical protein